MKVDRFKIPVMVVMSICVLLTCGITHAEAATQVEGKLNINTATVEEYVLLPMIGPSKAAIIVAYREENGPFESVEDLIQVKGIGRRTLQRLEPYLKLEGESDLRVVVIYNVEPKTAPTREEESGSTASEKKPESEH